MTRDYVRSLTTPVLRKMWERLRSGLASLPPEDRPREDLDALLMLRDELDRRNGAKKGADVEFSDYITD